MNEVEIQKSTYIYRPTLEELSEDLALEISKITGIAMSNYDKDSYMMECVTRAQKLSKSLMRRLKDNTDVDADLFRFLGNNEISSNP